MTIYYSATTNAFYDSQVYNVNNIPEDKVAVAESTYKNLMAQQCAGRVIVAAADGTPTTIAQTCGSCTSTKYATKTELTNGLAAKANDSNVVHKTGDEHINGVKSFGSVIKATNGTVQVGADTGYSVTFNYNGNITSKQARGTYNIFFPEGSGTLALTSDIDGKANDSAVVHKTGDETIAGVKTFTESIRRKNGSVDLTVTPTGDIYSHYLFMDKNDKISAYIENAQRSNGVNDLGLCVHDKNGGLHGFQITTNNEVLHLGNYAYSLGSPNRTWANAYIGRVVCPRFTHSVNNGSVYIAGGSEWDKGANFVLHGEESSDAGAFIINSRNKTRSLYLVGRPDGTLQWNGKNVALDENLVHRSGNETISGAKIFLNDIFRKNTSADLTVTPTGYTNTNIIFADKNDKALAHIEYVQRPSGVNDVGIIARDKNGNAHGIHINTNNEVIPLMSSSESYSLGSAIHKWANVYASEINTKYFTYTHDSRTSYSYLPKTSGTLAIQERTRASAAVENRALLYECAGGLDLGDITLNDMYSKFNALLIVYSDDDGGRASTYYLDCAELDIRRELAGSGTFLLVDGHSYWACTGASTGTKFVHSKNNGLRIHKIYGLAKYY